MYKYGEDRSRMLQSSITSPHTHPVSSALFGLIALLSPLSLLVAVAMAIAAIVTSHWATGTGSDGTSYQRGLYNQCNNGSCSMTDSCSAVGTGFAPSPTLCFEMAVGRGLLIAGAVCAGFGFFMALAAYGLSKKVNNSSSRGTGSSTYSDGTTNTPSHVAVSFSKLTVASIVTALLAAGAFGGIAAGGIIGSVALLNQLTLESYAIGGKGVGMSPGYSLLFNFFGAGSAGTALFVQVFLYAIPHLRHTSYVSMSKQMDDSNIEAGGNRNGNYNPSTPTQQGQYGNDRPYHSNYGNQPNSGRNQYNDNNNQQSSWNGWLPWSRQS